MFMFSVLEQATKPLRNCQIHYSWHLQDSKRMLSSDSIFVKLGWFPTKSIYRRNLDENNLERNEVR